MRYQCSVKQVTGERVTVTYHCQGRTSVELTIMIPDGKNPTPRWVEKKMRQNAHKACEIWDERLAAKERANRLDDWDVASLNQAYVDEDTGDGDVVEL